MPVLLVEIWTATNFFYLVIEKINTRQIVNERLFYFVHGVVTMFFLTAGWSRFRRHGSSQLEHLWPYPIIYLLLGRQDITLVSR